MTDTQKRLVLKIAGICCLISGLALMTVGGIYVMESVLNGKNMGFLRWTILAVGFFNTAAAVVILRIVARVRKSSTDTEP